MIVDFLRECYLSERRLFTGRPDLITRGRYFWAPPGARLLTIPHIFGSTYFIRQDVEDVLLGEVPPYGYRFIQGDPPPVVPQSRLCGPLPFFTAGDPGEGQVVDGNWGIITCCTGDLPVFPVSLAEIDLQNRRVQFALSALSRTSYEATGTNGLTIATAVFGPPTSSFFTPNVPSSLVPGFGVYDYPGFTVVVISGTTTPEQAVAQVVYSTFAPVNFGIYGTNALWRTAAVAIMTSLAILGIPSGKPVLIVGHSYGGALAYQVAGQYRAADPDREISVITFGSPKPGDSRLSALIATTNSLAVQAYADPIPALPPSDYWAGVFLGWAGPVGMANWSRYRLAGNAVELMIDGRETPVVTPPALVAQMLAILASVIVIAPFPVFAAHDSAEYYRRLYLQTGQGGAFPIGPDAMNTIIAVYPP